jgi:hypothetical protein
MGLFVFFVCIHFLAPPLSGITHLLSSIDTIQTAQCLKGVYRGTPVIQRLRWVVGLLR